MSLVSINLGNPYYICYLFSSMTSVCGVFCCSFLEWSGPLTVRGHCCVYRSYNRNAPFCFTLFFCSTYISCLSTQGRRWAGQKF